MNKSHPEFLEKYNFNLESYLNFKSKPGDNSSMDRFGNLVLSANIDVDEEIVDVDKFLMKVNAKKKKLNESQVELFMNTELTEFADQVATKNNESDKELISDFNSEIDSEIKSQLDQEQILQTQLSEMSNILDTEIERNVQFQEKSSENFAAAKDLIVSQRIELGEGKVPSDFSDEFPFLPLVEGQQNKNDSFPFMS